MRAALESALRDAVRTGRLHPGARLPSSRALARDLQIARNTVAEAYGQLVGEGWLVAVHGSGTSVANRVRRLRCVPSGARRRPAASDTTFGPGRRTCRPSRARSGWPRPAGRLAAPTEAFGYTDPAGRPELRAALADYLGRPAACGPLPIGSSSAPATPRRWRCCARC